MLGSRTSDCNILQRAATHMLESHRSNCNTLQHTATHCNTHTRVSHKRQQHTAKHCRTHSRVSHTWLQHTATCCNTHAGVSHKRQQHTATRCNTHARVPHTSHLRTWASHARVNTHARVTQKWLPRTATRCNMHTRVPYTSHLQIEYHDSCVGLCVAARCSVLQLRCSCVRRSQTEYHDSTLRYWTSILTQATATHCDALQHTATRCNTLQRAATCMLQSHTRVIYRLNFMTRVFDTEHQLSHKRQQHTAMRCNTLQRAATCMLESHTRVVYRLNVKTRVWDCVLQRVAVCCSCVAVCCSHLFLVYWSFTDRMPRLMWGTLTDWISWQESSILNINSHTSDNNALQRAATHKLTHCNTLQHARWSLTQTTTQRKNINSHTSESVSYWLTRVSLWVSHKRLQHTATRFKTCARVPQESFTDWISWLVRETFTDWISWPESSILNINSHPSESVSLADWISWLLCGTCCNAQAKVTHTRLQHTATRCNTLLKFHRRVIFRLWISWLLCGTLTDYVSVRCSRMSDDIRFTLPPKLILLTYNTICVFT